MKKIYAILFVFGMATLSAFLSKEKSSYQPQVVRYEISDTVTISKEGAGLSLGTMKINFDFQMEVEGDYIFDDASMKYFDDASFIYGIPAGTPKYKNASITCFVYQDSVVATLQTEIPEVKVFLVSLNQTFTNEGFFASEENVSNLRNDFQKKAKALVTQKGNEILEKNAKSGELDEMYKNVISWNDFQTISLLYKEKKVIFNVKILKP